MLGTARLRSTKNKSLRSGGDWLWKKLNFAILYPFPFAARPRESLPQVWRCGGRVYHGEDEFYRNFGSPTILGVIEICLLLCSMDVLFCCRCSKDLLDERVARAREILDERRGALVLATEPEILFPFFSDDFLAHLCTGFRREQFSNVLVQYPPRVRTFSDSCGSRCVGSSTAKMDPIFEVGIVHGESGSKIRSLFEAKRDCFYRLMLSTTITLITTVDSG